ncbi:MAG: LysR family transcriptional regulator [Pseudomonadota bacterium]
MEKIDLYRLDGHAMRVFLHIYDTQSVSRTADAFNLNQSTISHTLEKLRSALEDPLFIRAGRRIIPTERAEGLALQMRKIVAEIDGLRLTTDGGLDLSARPITIACNVTETLPTLARLRDLLWDTAPECELRYLELGSRENLEPILSSGAADLAISVHLPVYPAALTARTLLIEPMQVFYDPTMRGPITSVEEYCTARHGALDFGGSKKSNVAMALEAQSLSRRVILAAANVHVLGQLLRGTDLIATMQASLAKHAFSHLAHTQPPMILPNLRFDLVWHRRNEASVRNAWLRKQITALVQQANPMANQDLA